MTLFRNAQWVVTADGLDTVDGKYLIEKSRLKERDWLRHLGEKTWVNLEAFIEAYQAACAAHHIYVEDIDTLIAEARAERAENDGIDAVYNEMFPGKPFMTMHDLLDPEGRLAQAEAEYHWRQQAE